MECYRDGCPSGRLSHLHRGTLELCQSDHRVLGHLPDQGPSPPIVQFLPFKNDGGHCVLGQLQCCRNVLVPFPRSVPLTQSSSDNFLQPHDLVFALTCTVNCGMLYRQVSALPNHVKLIEFTTGGLQSSCRNMSRMINGKDAPEINFTSHSKGFEYFYTFKKCVINLQKILKTCFHFVIMGYYV